MKIISLNKAAALALVVLATNSVNAAVIYQANDGSNIDLYGRLGFNVSDKKRATHRATSMPELVSLHARRLMISWQ